MLAVTWMDQHSYGCDRYNDSDVNDVIDTAEEDKDSSGEVLPGGLIQIFATFMPLYN